MQKIIILISYTLILSGCASTVEHVNYVPPQGKPIAEVEFIALDKYRNSDTVDLSLVSRSSCSVKTEVAQVTSVSSGGLFAGKDTTYNAKAFLPANERINIQVRNISSSGYVTTHCLGSGSVILEANKKYSLKVKNWSTKESKSGGFGCEFAILEIDSSGKEVSFEKIARIDLPQCKSN